MLVDIFTRKLYAYLLKNKDKDSIFGALTDFFKKHQPEIIISDNDNVIIIIIIIVIIKVIIIIIIIFDGK